MPARSSGTSVRREPGDKGSVGFGSQAGTGAGLRRIPFAPRLPTCPTPENGADCPKLNQAAYWNQSATFFVWAKLAQGDCFPRKLRAWDLLDPIITLDGTGES